MTSCIQTKHATSTTHALLKLPVFWELPLVKVTRTVLKTGGVDCEVVLTSEINVCVQKNQCLVTDIDGMHDRPP